MAKRTRCDIKLKQRAAGIFTEQRLNQIRKWTRDDGRGGNEMNDKDKRVDE